MMAAGQLKLSFFSIFSMRILMGSFWLSEDFLACNRMLDTIVFHFLVSSL